MIEVMLSLTCQLVGIDPTQPNGQCLGVDQKTGKIGFLPAGNLENGEIGGAIGGMNNMITVLYNPPIHTGDYFQNLAQNFGITKKTYAQQTGTGFDSLSALLNLWSAFRNIVYLVFVIVFIVIGLAIMFRVKIDPRTVMTIQNQIPKIIIGILLVTFSYAIAGFFIDLMWILIHLIYNVISGVPGTSVNNLNPTHMQGSSTFGAMGFGNITDIISNASRGVGEFLGSLLGGGGGGVGIGVGIAGGAATGALAGTLIAPVIGTIIGGILGSLIGGFGGGFGVGPSIGSVAGILAFFIIAITLLMALFRLWFTLLTAYVFILIDVVLAPFWIIGSLVPGSPINVTGWLKDLGANLLAFPVTIGMFILGRVFMDAFESKTEGQFVPPLIGNPGDTNAISALIGLGIVLITPNVVNILKAALKAPKIDTGGVGRAIGAGAGAPMGIIRTGGNLGSTLFGLSNVPVINRIPFLSKLKGTGVHPPPGP